MKVELIYASDCPNVEMTRAQLLKAFATLQLPAKWVEWDTQHPQTPDYAKQYGSPTILINGQDCIGERPTDDPCCRLYSNKQIQQGFPTVDMLIHAFNKAKSSIRHRSSKAFHWKNVMVSLPSILIALLPKLTCPMCWPAYAGILSALGISFVNYTAYLFPLTLFFLFVALLSLIYRARYRRGYRPLILGLMASGLILVGKFIFHINSALYVGVILLMIATFWHSWPVKKDKHCQNCQ